MLKSCFFFLPFSTACFLNIVGASAEAAVLHVGPGATYATPCRAIAAAIPGDVIEIAPVLYSGDVCPIYTSNLTLMGVNGRAHIAAAGKNSQGKGIWPIYGNNTIVENVEFSGATVVDNNGAGIRLASGLNLTVRNCYFHDNQEGILSGTGGNVLIEYSEFNHNGSSDGQAHNLYIGHANSLTFRFNWSHNSIVGHLLKSRAATNHIVYNRLSDETGNGSIELDLPNGGNSYVIGNVIQQGPNSPNHAILTYLEEGVNVLNPGMELFVINNTFVNDAPAGKFISIAAVDTVPVVVKNNIFAGAGTLCSQPGAVLMHNFAGNPLFVNKAAYNYQLSAGSPAINAGIGPGIVNGLSLLPVYQYVQPSCGQMRALAGTLDIGAYEYGGRGALLSCR